MADWFAVYQESDGKLLSVGTVITDPLRSGLAKKRISGPPAREVWNTTTLEFDPLPPPPPKVDRVDEFIDAMPKNGTNFKEAVIRDELAKLLGDFRFRDSGASRDLDRGSGR